MSSKPRNDRHLPEIGPLLRQFRIEAGLTQEALAEQAGLGVRSVQGIELGEHRPRRETVLRLSQVLGLTGADRTQFEAAARSAPRGRPTRTASVQLRKLPFEVRTGGARRHNLPAALTSFVGRECELATIRDILGKTRLLTLTGAGGVGKTRLALQVARDLLDRYHDGIWLVDLAPLADPSLVPLAVATALDLYERAGEPVATTVCTFLEGRQPLLILDNCEHLAEACGRLARDLLQACPEVSILATSRQPLRLIGEAVFRVPSLPAPAVEPPYSGDLILSCDAARLFVERASAVRPDLVLSPDDVVRIGQICRRLDGIPLALELASARLSALTIEQIERRLDQQFRLLTIGDPTALPRHQTLRTTLDWSYALLDEPERWLWRRLAVFAGGFTLEAAERTYGQDGVPTDDIAELVTQLVDKSLVVMEEHNGEARYHLLEPLRQYAWEKLDQAGEVMLSRDRHRDWCLDLVERAGNELNGPKRKQWFVRLDQDIDNVRTALGWCAESHEGVRVGLAIVTILEEFWTRHGHLNEGRQYLTGLLARGEAMDPQVRYRALTVAGHLAQLASAYHEADALLVESLALWRQSRASAADLGPLNVLGAVRCNLGDYAGARALLNEHRANARAVGNIKAEAGAVCFLGIIAKREGDLDLAEELQEQSMALGSSLNHEWSAVTSLFELGAIANIRGDQMRARFLFQKSLATWERFDDRTGLAMSINGLSWVASALGQPERAARLSGAAAALRDAAGLGIWGSHRDQDDESTARAKLALGEAGWQIARDEGRAMRLEKAIAYALEEDPR